MALITPDNRFFQVNQVLCEMLGYRPQDLEGRTFIDITVPEDLDSDLPLARKLFSGEIPRYSIDKRYIRKDGTTLWVTLSGSALYDRSGNIEYGLAMIEDIDRRKQMEQELSAASKLADRTARVARVGGWEIHLDTGKVVWSPEVYRIYGLPESREPPQPEEAISFYAEHCRETIRHAFTKCATDGTPFDLELELIDAGGKSIWVRARGEADPPNGTPTHLFGTFQDITIHHRTRVRIQEANRRMELVLSNGNIGLWDWNVSENLVRFDDNWWQQLDLPTDSNTIDVPTLLDLIHPDDRAITSQNMQAIVAGEIDQCQIEHRLRTRSGAYRWVVARGSVLQRDDAGLPTHVAGTHFDITERRENEEELRAAHTRLKEVNHDLSDAIARSQMLAEEAREAEHAKGEFLAVMSHEIRTPLNAILGMTSLLSSTKLTDEQREYAETIRESGQALTTLISDILDYSKLDAGAVDLEIVSTNIVELAAETINLVAERAEEKGLDIGYDIGSNVPSFVMADPHRLRQALLNLLSNAVKFTPQGTIKLAIETVYENPEVVSLRIAVEDTGIGINERNRERLFHPFSQADFSITRKFGGTGLGLVIARKIVSRMNGTITVQTEENVGSTFIIELPFHKDQRVVLRSEGSALVVSHRETVRQTLMGLLAHLGIKATGISSPGEARKSVESDPPNCILADHLLGKQATELLGLGCPVVLMTSLDRTKEQCSGRHFQGRLPYPPRPSALNAAIRRAIQPSTSSQSSQLIKRARFDPAVGQKNPLSILIVEDNATNRRVINLLLSKMGYSPDEAVNGKEAIQAWERKQYDLILMDVHMPEMDGIAATIAIRNHENHAGYRRTRIFALTADARTENVRETVAAGMDGHLSKPLDPRRLQSILSSVASDLRSKPSRK